MCIKFELYISELKFIINILDLNVSMYTISDIKYRKKIKSTNVILICIAGGCL